MASRSQFWRVVGILRAWVAASAFSIMSAGARKKTCTISRLAPFPTHCTLVWNPVIPRARIVGSIYERHGNKAALQESCIANLDGQDIRLKTRSVIFPDNAISIKEAKAFLKSFDRCETKFLWVPEFNLIHPGPFKNPRKRSNYPSMNTMKAINALLKG